MAIITKENILRVLAAYNPWWQHGEISQTLTKKYKRFAYNEAILRLENSSLRRCIVLTGTRRVGKTTIQYQIIENLLNKGIDPKKIIYISLDHPILKLSGFQDVLTCYHENIYPNQDVYYFFDEVQYVAEWDKWLKAIYDMQQESNVIATGSASPILMKGSQESGAGRWSLIEVPTLSFFEYCELINVQQPLLPSFSKITDMFSMSKQEQTTVMLALSEVQKHFIRYLQVGGFPELALSSNDLLAMQIMREDVVDKVLKRDLPSLYNVRNSTELERIFLYLCNISSEIVSIETIAKELNGVSRPTVENYIKYLESAHLIYQSWPVEMGGKKILKASPKIYISDAAIRNSVLMDESIITNPTEMGKIVETAIYKHIYTFYQQKTIPGSSVGYLRMGQKDKEIDIVVNNVYKKNILIEVKYRENSPLPASSAIIKMCDEALFSIVITKNANDYGLSESKENCKIFRIPAFAFLYLLGVAEKNNAMSI